MLNWKKPAVPHPPPDVPSTGYCRASCDSITLAEIRRSAAQARWSDSLQSTLSLQTCPAATLTSRAAAWLTPHCCYREPFRHYYCCTAAPCPLLVRVIFCFCDICCCSCAFMISSSRNREFCVYVMVKSFIVIDKFS